MKYLHTMVRVTDVDASLAFYCDALGLEQLRRYDNEAGRFSLIFLAAPGDHEAQVELTYNWDPESYDGGRNFGHLAYAVEDIYATCQRLADAGVVRRLGLHERAAYFTLVLPGQHRDYLICTECGMINPVDAPCPVHDLEDEIREKT